MNRSLNLYFFRFTSSAIQQWKSIEKSYFALIRAFFVLNPGSAEDIDEELKYKICGQDFIYDLLFLLDVFAPVSVMMTAVQGMTTPIWKACKWARSLITFLGSISTTTGNGLPLLSQYLEEVKDMKFKGVELIHGYIIVETIVEDDDAPAGPAQASKSKKSCSKKKYEWRARELQECEVDGMRFVKDLVKSLKHRTTKGIHKVCSVLEQAVDLHGLICQLCGEAGPNKRTPYDAVKLARHGVDAFTRLFTFASSLPHLKDAEDVCFDPILSTQVYDKLKNTFALLL